MILNSARGINNKKRCNLLVYNKGMVNAVKGALLLSRTALTTPREVNGNNAKD